MNNHYKQIPKLFKIILSRLSIYEEMFSISWDFQREYSGIFEEGGRVRAFFWLLGSTLQAAGFYFLLTARSRSEMFKNYFKIAYRNIKGHKVFSFINVAGLATGIAAALFMLMYVVSERNFDDFHLNKDRIYRVTGEWEDSGGARRFAASMPGIAPVLEQDLPGVEKAARIRPVSEAVVTIDKNLTLKLESAFYADPQLFEIFSWPLLQGAASAVLSEPFTVVLSQSSAGRFFGHEDCMGKSLNVNGQLYSITGVMEDSPANSHLQYEMLISYSTIQTLGEYPDNPWSVWGDDYTYILIKENTDLDNLRAQLNSMVGQYSETWFAERMSLGLQPLSEIHWDLQSRGDMGAKGSTLYVYIFLSASILVLLIACFNFINLSTSRYLDRMKEVGVRKVNGAGRGQLIQQLLVESLLVATISAVIGVYLFHLLNKSLYSILALEVILNARHFFLMYGMIFVLILLIGIVAGGYPALYLSKFRPADILKPGTTYFNPRSPIRQILVVVQFSISIILIVGTATIYRQLDFMKNSDLGFDKENVVLVQLPYGDPELQQKYPVIRDRFLNHPRINSASGAYSVPGLNSQFRMSVKKNPGGENESYSLQVLPGDFGFLDTMGLQIVEGRDFSREFSLDSQESVILNQSAVKALDLKDPLNKKIIMAGDRQMSVIGVIKDFHIASLHTEIAPMIVYIEPKMYGTMAVKIASTNSEETLLYMEETWAEVLPMVEFNHRFMEDAYAGYYRSEEKTGKLMIIFTCLALLVSCMGLFGLATFITSKRIKEIGVRKVLGATSGQISILLTKQFAKWVVISNLAAWPVAYYLLSRWLENFVYRIDLGLLQFVLSGLAALVVAVLTVSFQTAKTALSDPVHSLRYE